MTPNSLKKQIALLKKEGINRILLDVLKEYEQGRWTTDLAEIAEQIAQTLSARYKEQLPKKVVRVKQKTLDMEILDAKQQI